MFSKNSLRIWLLIIPTLGWFYVGLFLTLGLWYPHGLGGVEWTIHVLNFSIVYILWMVAFFTYQLFDLDSLRSLPKMMVRLMAVFVALVVIAVVYFYFQPQLLITPRRFLLVHVLISGIGITIWYSLVHLVLPRTWVRTIFAHETIPNEQDLANFVREHEFLGFRYQGVATPDNAHSGALIIFPSRADIDAPSVQSLYALRRRGVRFVEFYDFYENLTRKVHLDTLNELWFLSYIDYGSHQFSDIIKRIVDIILGLIAGVVFVTLFLPLALLIKLSSPGPIFFKQPRVGKDGIPFILYKYRSMSGGATNTWTQVGDSRITFVGKWLRRLRFDELPQVINILRGDMSFVGPRPEQVHIVEELKEQVPYYDERHIVKPGLTGWAQLHVYAGNLEETRRKLQYDLYYIKHRGFLFDMEIILRTIYKIITFNGR
jgi:lipopolysaccharide/colanic/teichoic acid biosynthesis glycosyltransferase